MSNVCRGGLNRFVVTVDTVGNGVTRINGKDVDDGAMVSNPSHSAVSAPGSSLSQRVQAVKSSPVPPVWWSTAAVDVDEDWSEEWCYAMESDWMEDWHEDGSWHNPEEYTSERHDDESSYLVCGVAGSSPNLSGSQSTAGLCGLCERLRDRRFREGETVGHPGVENGSPWQENC